MPSPSDVRAELERILSSPYLQASGRRRAFLRFIVEETLSDSAGRLKGYTIATSVFGRDETFDSRSDPVVRLEARRLRRDLDSYYVDAGSRDPVRISIPKGSYAAHFEWQEMMRSHAVSDGGQPASNGQTPARSHAPPSHASPSHASPSLAPPSLGPSGIPGPIFRSLRKSDRTLLLVILAAVAVTVAALTVAMVWFVMTDRRVPETAARVREPAVAVLPFEALDTTEYSRFLADGISEDLIADLMRFPGFRLYILPAGVGKDTRPAPAELGRELNVAYVIGGSVRADAEGARIAARIYDAASGQVLWTGSYDRPLVPGALIRAQSILAGEIATVIGQPYGVVRSDLEQRLETPAVSDMQSYVCVLRAYGYRRNFPREEFDRVLSCLGEAVRRDPGYSDAWAMLGWLHLDAGRYQYDDMRGGYAKALDAATRAVAIEPDNALALKALAAVKHYIGRYDESEALARRALELNPHDPDTLAQLGWRLAVRGKFEEGIPVLKRAIERTVNPPGWYFHLVAIDLYLKEDYTQMLRIAERSAVDGSPFSQALIAIANGALGDREAARRALEKMSAFETLARDPAAYSRRHGAIEEIAEAIDSGLRKAGWTPPGT